MATITGTNFADKLNGGSGSDVIYGLGGNDSLVGNGGDDSLYGGTGKDTLVGGSGNDFLDGGDDYDFLDGGAGNDYLVGGAGKNNFTLSKSGESDYVADFKDGDTVRLGTGVQVGDLIIYNDTFISQESDPEGGLYSQHDLIVQLSTGASLTLDSFWDGANPNGLRIYGDGLLSLDTLRNMAFNGTSGDDVLGDLLSNDAIYGNGGNDTLRSYDGEDSQYGGSGDDLLYHDLNGRGLMDGGSGNDTLDAWRGNDTLLGGSGGDVMFGYAGQDSFVGGVGDDYASGGSGNDTYVFGVGDGVDYVYDYDSTAGNVDVLRMGTNEANLVFSRVDDNLEIGISGTADKVIVLDWFFGSETHIEEIRTADGGVILDSEIDGLVSAMAAFDPASAAASAAASIALRVDQQTPVLAAS